MDICMYIYKFTLFTYTCIYIYIYIYIKYIYMRVLKQSKLYKFFQRNRMSFANKSVLKYITEITEKRLRRYNFQAELDH